MTSSIHKVQNSGPTTVHVLYRVIARREIKNLAKMTSAERGTLVTVAFGISALGNIVPSFCVFPRIHYKDHFIGSERVGSDVNPSG